jgi:Tetratricopeptide repeat
MPPATAPLAPPDEPALDALTMQAARRRRTILIGWATLIGVGALVGLGLSRRSPPTAMLKSPAVTSPTEGHEAKATAPTSVPAAKPAAPVVAPTKAPTRVAEPRDHKPAPRHRVHRREHRERVLHTRRSAKVDRARTVEKPAPPDRTAARDAYQRGNDQLFTGDAAGAAAAYQEAVKVAPSDPAGYRGLGLAYEKQGKVDEAVAAFRRYLKLAPHSRDRDLVARRLQRLTHPGDDGVR